MIKVFETFAGIGAQKKALSILKEKGFQSEIIATSEWDVWANINYYLIHNFSVEKIANKAFNREEALEFLKKFNHSFDSKNEARFERIKSLDDRSVMYLYNSYLENNNLGSILEIKATDILKKSPSGVDLITYSFPCQDLSTAGNVHGFNKGMAKSSGTRSGLLWQIERILLDLNSQGKRPKYLLLENVRNMLSNRHIGDYRTWLGKLHKMGYKTQTYLLDAIDYGIPQLRRRVFALSVREDVAKKNNFYDTLEKSMGLEIIERYHIPGNEVIMELNLNKKMCNLIKNDYSKSKYFNEATQAIPNDTPSRQKIYNLNKWIQEPWDQYCRTITTKQDRHPNAAIIPLIKNQDKLLYQKYSTPKSPFRYLTPRETFLLMGFEEADFDRIKENNFTRNEVLYRQAGNSIVVNCLVSIFNEIWKMEKSND